MNIARSGVGDGGPEGTGGCGIGEGNQDSVKYLLVGTASSSAVHQVSAVPVLL
jgi:hypothetical protein